MKLSPVCYYTACLLFGTANAFLVPQQQSATRVSSTERAGWFDKWTAGGTGNTQSALDEQWEAQQEILRNRRKPQAERNAYFEAVEKRRAQATEKQQNMWAWQTKTYGKGEDPIDEWRKRRADGSISDLENQYGDEKKMGGIPLPMASFGVGGEFGVGGKFDNGGRKFLVVWKFTSSAIFCRELSFSKRCNAEFFAHIFYFSLLILLKM